MPTNGGAWDRRFLPWRVWFAPHQSLYSLLHTKLESLLHTKLVRIDRETFSQWPPATLTSAVGAALQQPQLQQPQQQQQQQQQQHKVLVGGFVF